jgi:hypothetical protein
MNPNKPVDRRGAGQAEEISLRDFARDTVQAAKRAESKIGNEYVATLIGRFRSRVNRLLRSMGDR